MARIQRSACGRFHVDRLDTISVTWGCEIDDGKVHRVQDLDSSFTPSRRIRRMSLSHERTQRNTQAMHVPPKDAGAPAETGAGACQEEAANVRVQPGGGDLSRAVHAELAP